MTLARRLLMAGGGSGSFTPPAYSFTLSAAPSGGWVPIIYPKATQSGGLTFYGYNAGNTGNVEVRAYTNATGVTSSAFDLHSALSGLYGAPEDDHVAPALLVRSSDSKLVACYCTQGDVVMRRRISTNALDVSAWDAEGSLSLGGSNYLYPVLVQLAGEASGRIYLHWKDFPGSTYIRQSISDDGGATFSASNRIWVSTNAFFAIGSDDNTRMDFVTSDTAPTNGSANGLYHFYEIAGQLYKSNGTAISTAIPIGTTDATQVYSGGGAAFPYSLVYTGDGRPVISYAVFGTNPVYHDLRWTGSTWRDSVIVAAGEAAFFGSQPPGITHIKGNANRAILGKSVGSGVFEMFDYRSTDDGVTWTQHLQLTTGSGASIPQTPTTVTNAAAEVAVLWTFGTFTSDYDYSVGTAGAP